MSIDATVHTVIIHEDGDGELQLRHREDEKGNVVGIAGQDVLRYKTAPHEVTALNGLNVWGGSGDLMLGDIRIAKRAGYTSIVFESDEVFKAALRSYKIVHDK